jgi:DegV family protein with EDD domain
MASICILTDSTAQFTRPTFPGRSLVHAIPLRIRASDDLLNGENELKVCNLPPTLKENQSLALVVPDVEEYRQLFINLGREYNEIVALMMSSHLSPATANAIEAATSVRGRVAVQVIDSQTTSVGLGYLAQVAAEAASQHASSSEIERLLRGIIPHIYSIYCIPGLSYLHRAGFIDHAQATVGEMLGLLSIIALEDGHLTPMEKARNFRHLTDFFQEFLDEFTELHHVSLIQSVPAMSHEGRVLREHAATNFPKTPFSEHPIGLALSSLFGPRTLGMIAVEVPDSD